jgi:TetR/AcrR family transcriptional repressor of multidrug resistance operon
MRTRNLEKEAAIKTVALQLIADEGLENLTMQRLAEAAGISPRTIYLKYENKEDLLIKLFIDEVLGAYEAHALADFDPRASLAVGLKRIWMNVFTYLTGNRPAFVLLQYGKSSPLLNKAFKERNIKEGDYFGPIHRFIKYQIQQGVIRNLPVDIYRTVLFSPLLDLVGEYFDHLERPKQIVTPKVLEQCLEMLIKGIAL